MQEHSFLKSIEFGLPLKYRARLRSNYQTTNLPETWFLFLVLSRAYSKGVFLVLFQFVLNLFVSSFDKYKWFFLLKIKYTNYLKGQ